MIELNEQNFNKTIEDKKIVLVDFYATWCGPCGMQKMVLERLQSSRNIEFDIAKVNVDEAPKLAIKYGVDSIPTIMIFKNNELVKRCVGYTTEEEILKMIEEIKD